METMIRLRRFSSEKLFELLKDACGKETAYWTERKSYPDTDDLVKSTERDEMVAYLLEVCEREDMQLSVEAFALCVTLLDRFLASFKVKSKYLECLAVACLYIACKVREEDEKISITSEFLLDCNCKCSIAELLRMEFMVLTKFEWNVNDITSIDFLYLYYALLINNYSINSTEANNKSNDFLLNKRKPKHEKTQRNQEDGFEPPKDLDFLHVLEHKLKQCLCVNELTTMFRPHVIAFSLLTIQVEKCFGNESSNEISSQSVFQMMNLLKLHSKVSDELVSTCKEQINFHLASLEANKTLLDRYLDEYYFDMARNKKTSLFNTPLLSAINSQLTVIKEEEEDEIKKELLEDNIQELVTIPKFSNNHASNMLSNLTNISNRCYLRSSSCETMPSCDESCEDNSMDTKSNHLTYADILKGGRIYQKRKLSENSSTDEDFECDYENRQN